MVLWLCPTPMGYCIVSANGNRRGSPLLLKKENATKKLVMPTLPRSSSVDRKVEILF
mgnify:CR=1 FL=1